MCFTCNLGRHHVERDSDSATDFLSKPLVIFNEFNDFAPCLFDAYLLQQFFKIYFPLLLIFFMAYFPTLIKALKPPVFYVKNSSLAEVFEKTFRDKGYKIINYV